MIDLTRILVICPLVLLLCGLGCGQFNDAVGTQTDPKSSSSPDADVVVGRPPAPSLTARSESHLPLPVGPSPQMILQTGHPLKSHIAAAEFSRDGRRLATASDNEIILWDVATGRQVTKLMGVADRVESIAFSPDRRRLLADCDDFHTSRGPTAVVWDLTSGRLIHELKRPRSGPVAYSTDGGFLATASGNVAFVWDADTGEKLRTVGPLGKRIVQLHFSPRNNDLLALFDSETLDQPNGLVVWNTENGQQWESMVIDDGILRGVRYSPDGTCILASIHDSDWPSSQGETRAWGSRSLTLLKRFPGVSRPILSADGKKLFSAEATIESSLNTWDFEESEKTGTIEPGIYHTVSLDGRWGLRQKETQWTISDLQEGKQASVLRSVHDVPRRLVFSRDGSQLAAIYTFRRHDVVGLEIERAMPDYKPSPGYAAIWETKTGRLRAILSPIDAIFGGGAMRSGADYYFSPDGKSFCSVTDGHVRIWDPHTGRLLLQGPTDEVKGFRCAGYDQQGRWLLGRAVVDGKSVVVLLDAATLKLVRSLELPPKSQMPALTFRDDGNEILAGIQFGTWIPDHKPIVNKDGTISVPALNLNDLIKKPKSHLWTVWNARSGEVVWKSDERAGILGFNVAVNPDGKRVAVVDETTQGAEKSINLIDIESGTRLKRFRLSLNTPGPFNIKFDREGKTMLVFDEQLADKTRVFDVSTGDLLATVQGHTANIEDCVFRPDREQLVTCSWDRTVRFWNKREIELARLICLQRGKEWVAATPNGFFDASVEGRQLICWRIGSEAFPLELYEKILHRPDVVSASLNDRKIDDLPAVPATHAPPQVKLKAVKIDALSVHLKAIATAGSDEGRIKRLRVMIDGRDVVPEVVDRIKAETSGKVTEFSGKVDFPAGKRSAVIAAIATDQFGLTSDPVAMTILRPGPATPVDRTLYVLAVGVSKYKFPGKNLNFAHADSQALAELLGKQQGKAFKRVQTNVLVDEQATIPNIRKGLSWLAENCRRDDVVIVQFSGHAGRSSRGKPYFVPHEADDEAIRETYLPWDDIAHQLGRVQASAVLFLSDCCHAGAFGQRAATHDELALPLLNARVMVFAACRGSELSIESGNLKHGAFTYAVLRGLRGEADRTRDRRITVSELQEYVSQQVAVLTADQQHPHIPRMNDFDPQLVIAHLD